MQTSTHNSHNTKVNMMWGRTNATNRQTGKRQRSIWCSLFGGTDRETCTQMRPQTLRETSSSGMKKAQGDTHKTRKQVLVRTHTWTNANLLKMNVEKVLEALHNKSWYYLFNKAQPWFTSQETLYTAKDICRVGIPANLTCHWSWQDHVKRWGYSSLQL